jgi:hypothetical protein
MNINLNDYGFPNWPFPYDIFCAEHKDAIFIIPVMSQGCYLGGIAALNLPSDSGTGDWHMQETFSHPRKELSRSFISGVGRETDTTSLLGDAGLFDCTALLDELSIRHEGECVFAASHARATADLVLSVVMRGGCPDFVVLDDWMPRDNDKQEVYALLAQAIPKLPLEQQEKVLEWKSKNAL